MNIYRNIDRTRLQLDFAVHSDEEGFYDEEIRQLGGRIYHIPRYCVYNHVGYVRSWQSLLQDHDEWNIVHGHVMGSASIYLQVAKKMGCVTISHSHNTSNGKGIEAAVKNVVEWPLRRIPDYCFACSVPAGEFLFGKKMKDNENFYVLKNGIDTDRFAYSEESRRKVREELGIRDNFVVGHVGRFSSQKNHTFILTIFDEVWRRQNDAELLLIGDGELKGEMEELCHKRGMHNVHFLGNRTDIPDLLSAMDIFLFPSLYEGLSLSAIEAQASGLPCLFSDSITEDNKVTDNVKFLSLESPVDLWAEQVLNFDCHLGRNGKNDIVRAEGYDIKEVARWLTDFYLDKANTKKRRVGL